MSKKCPWCKVDVYLTEIKHWWRCPECQTEFPERAFPKESTLFDRITASPEVLAEKLVYRYDGNGTWRSFLLYGYEFLTKAEAIAATIARLKEVDKDEK
jgi:hypothetical protein